MKNKVQLITYADRLGDGTIKSMTDILRTRFDGVYDGVHILPFLTGIFDDTRADNGKRIREKGVDRICQPMALIRRCKYKNQSGRCNGNARQNKPPCRKQQAL